MHDRYRASMGEVLARLFWIFVGPLALAVLAFAIVKTGNGWLTGPDFAFLGLLAGVMLARCLEFRGGHAQTADGEPATPAHLRRYLVGATLIGLAVWVVANVIGNNVLGH